MPEKSVREMSDLERKHYSLAARTFHLTLFGAILLGICAELIGLGLYTYALVGQYIGESFGLARSTAAIINQVVELDDMSQTVMGTYASLTEEERAATGTEDYRARFAALTETEDYRMLMSILKEFHSSSDVYDLYIAMYDRESSAMVYFVDPDHDPETWCAPGDWEEVNRKEMERFLAWDGEGKLYDVSNTKNYGWMCTAGVPVRNAAGEVIAFVLADVTLGNVARGMRQFVLLYTLAMVVIMVTYDILITQRIKRVLVAPINAIAEAAHAYAEDRRAGKPDSDHFGRLAIRTGDEIENLSLVMADMEEELADYVENLTEVTAEKERISTELNLATRIQATILPNIFPPFPERREFDIYAMMEPAKEVGGDFYDFFMIDEDHLGLSIADVSGKGVPAALFMMTSRTMIKDAAIAGSDPAAILTRVNRQISEQNSYYMFVTVWLGILTISTGKLIWADAGHEKPLVYQNGAWSFLPKHAGVAIGALEPELLELDDEPPFVNQTLTLSPGDVLFQYTDGVTEAMTVSREQFGDDRLLAAAGTAPSVQPEELLPYIREEVRSFAGDAEQFDDITMLAIRYRGPAGPTEEP